VFHIDVRHAFRFGLVALLALGTVAHAELTAGGGGGGTESDPSAIGALAHEIAYARRLTTLHEVAVRYHDVGAAQEAGYARCADCRDDTLWPGAVRFADNGSVDGVGVVLEEPRLFVYEPRPSGELRLIGVEYVVPVDAWYGAGHDAPPTLFGRAFARTEALLDEPAYALFVSVEHLDTDGGAAH